MTLAIIVMALLVLAREYSHNQMIDKMQQSIDKLTDKLMSRDFSEYKENTRQPVVFEPVGRTDEEEYWREIEEQKQ